jgi:hypothetical protein
LKDFDNNSSGIQEMQMTQHIENIIISPVDKPYDQKNKKSSFMLQIII